MRTESHCDVAVVGAGIVGLAHAWAAARRGLSVTVFERDARAVGASVRNFGLGLLVGQPPGDLFELAQASLARWRAALSAAGCSYKAAGALLVARDALELAVLEDFQDRRGTAYGTRLLSAAEVAGHGAHGIGGLYSGAEIALDARAVLPALARWLAEAHGVRFVYDCQVNAIEPPRLATSAGSYRAERVFVCAGHDFQTLYPAAFAPLGLRRCTLQMLRLASPGFALGPALMTGLSTLHYGAFADCAGLAALRAGVAEREPLLLEHGIHLIVQQVGAAGDPHGELIVGDSHHYGSTPSPFGDEAIDRLMLGLAETLLGRRLAVRERWLGCYASGPHPYEVVQPEAGVTAVAITAGVGMSIAFALAERHLAASA
ncbi:TIGR03364 family FAD-dependent oxidoreductase [Chitinimonas koreensis]|uniref:TIGR03364 family FAD-dependent oxidoreductase n=1 Tax=Chitinimonas koreensis TaxID=356302 RepID=UPI0003FBDED5|nr:TIGR03364 family FAD-dependent oxidoreductase [Chitinimonas koreensis]QNM98599.1 TIGR03364 family FAD-dependent oxidoreductase [Chitinimonas koreensis]